MDHGARHGKYDFNDIFKTDISSLDDICRLFLFVYFFILLCKISLLYIVVCLSVLNVEKIIYNYYTEKKYIQHENDDFSIAFILYIVYCIMYIVFEVNNLFIRISRRHCALFQEFVILYLYFFQRIYPLRIKVYIFFKVQIYFC